MGRMSWGIVLAPFFFFGYLLVDIGNIFDYNEQELYSYVTRTYLDVPTVVQKDYRVVLTSRVCEYIGDENERFYLAFEVSDEFQSARFTCWRSDHAAKNVVFWRDGFFDSVPINKLKNM